MSVPPSCEVVRWLLDEPPQTVSQLSDLLSNDEQARAAAFTRADPSRRFVVGRGRLRELLGARLGIDPASVGFRYGPAGKPEVEDDVAATRTPLHFNLAHSADLAVCAVSDRPVGVDLERVRPMKNAAALAERWFHPAEVARIAAADDPLAEFFRTWTMKEAVLKLVGVGVGESLPKVLTPDDPTGGVASGLPANDVGIATCRVECVETVAGFAAALATPPPG